MSAAFGANAARRPARWELGEHSAGPHRLQRRAFLERAEEGDQVGLVLLGEADVEALVVEVDDGVEVGGEAVVEDRSRRITVAAISPTPVGVAARNAEVASAMMNPTTMPTISGQVITGCRACPPRPPAWLRPLRP
jgi:hypothetical protein